MKPPSFAAVSAWWCLLLNVCIVGIDVAQGHYRFAILPALVIMVVAAWLAVLDAFQRWAEAHAGKAIADRALSDLTLKHVGDAIARGQVRRNVEGERSRAVN